MTHRIFLFLFIFFFRKVTVVIALDIGTCAMMRMRTVCETKAIPNYDITLLLILSVRALTASEILTWGTYFYFFFHSVILFIIKKSYNCTNNKQQFLV